MGKIEEHKWNREVGCRGMGTTFPGVISKDLTEEVTFEQRLEE